MILAVVFILLSCHLAAYILLLFSFQQVNVLNQEGCNTPRSIFRPQYLTYSYNVVGVKVLKIKKKQASVEKYVFADINIFNVMH